jgi:hypothetical protein
MFCCLIFKRSWLTPHQSLDRCLDYPKSWEQAQEELGSIEVTMGDSSLSSMAQPFGIVVSFSTSGGGRRGIEAVGLTETLFGLHRRI